jgi:NAD(P)-dependent dehydrogenase (short-subunit alcohol dehydrogenase family)
MDLGTGKVAVVTGAASGIGFALADRFARSGMDVVLADVDENGLTSACERIRAHGVDAAAKRTDVADEEAVGELADMAYDRFGEVHVLCNNAGVGSFADPWFGPISAWHWILGVNLWGVVHGVRAFLPRMLAQAEGHIVNTASMAGLQPGASPIYDASKHAVVALSEDLYLMLRQMQAPVGVSVLCPGWVRTNILDAERNWPASLGTRPDRDVVADVVFPHVQRAVDEGTNPAVVVDLVANAVMADRFWVLPHPEFVDLAVRRWHSIAEGLNPELNIDVPGMPPTAQIADEIRAALSPTN